MRGLPSIPRRALSPGNAPFSRCGTPLAPDVGVMQKRPVVVAVVMFLASLVSYDVVHMTAAGAALEVADSSASSVGVAVSVAPQVLPLTAVEVGDMLGAVSDPAVFFAAGVVLFGLAAGVRRHTS